MGKRHAHPSKASRRRSRNETDLQNNRHYRMTFLPSPAKIAARMSAPDTREIILEARELTREFDGVKALDRFSFKLHRGEVLGLLGANGAGKTTAMNCLLGLTLPTSGELTAFGLPLQANRIKSSSAPISPPPTPPCLATSSCGRTSSSSRASMACRIQRRRSPS
jgi:ABC-type glutathione transport system ATPase component